MLVDLNETVKGRFWEKQREIGQWQWTVDLVGEKSDGEKLGDENWVPKKPSRCHSWSQRQLVGEASPADVCVAIQVEDLAHPQFGSHSLSQ